MSLIRLGGPRLARLIHTLINSRRQQVVKSTKFLGVRDAPDVEFDSSELLQQICCMLDNSYVTHIVTN